MFVQTPEEYIKGFPHKVLPKIHGAPNYQSIRLVNKKLAANASTIKTTLGGGRHGYLALCMSPTAYSSYSLIAFVPPVNPGPIPTFPIRATAVTVAALEATHKENLRAWEEYNAVMQALKNQLIEASTHYISRQSTTVSQNTQMWPCTLCCNICMTITARSQKTS